MELTKYINEINENIDSLENVTKVLELITNKDCDENDILRITKDFKNEVEVLNYIAINAINNKVYDIVIPLLNRALEIEPENVEVNYSMAFLLNMFGENKLALDYLIKVNGQDENVDRLKKQIIKELSNVESDEKDMNAIDYFIDPSCDVRKIHRMKICSGVVVQRDSWLDIAYENPNHKYIVEIGKGTNIGRRCVISAANKVVIGENVLIASNVYIADCGHEYKDINTPIMYQGITGTNNEVHIGSGSWIGANSAIFGNVTVGRNCVIGTNSVVKKDIPDYCVAVGSPAKIIKMYDLKLKQWVRIENTKQIDKILEERKLQQMYMPIEKLESLQVEVSSACNLKCPQCFNNLKEHKTGILKKELWNDKIRPILKYLKRIHLVGIGEPLLCPNFFEYVDECVKFGIHVFTTSNLQLVNDEIAERIVTSGISDLSFSCDGSTNETYEKIRINGKLDKVIESLELINKYKKKYKSKLPNLTLNFGALKWNITELPDVIELANKLQVNSVIAYHDIIYYKELEKLSLYNYQEISDDMFSKAEKLANKYGIKYFCPGTFKNPIKYNCSEGDVYCIYPFSHLWIYSDGRVGPCCMDFPKRIIVGDLDIESIEEVWNNNKMLGLRKSMIGNVREECSYCARHGKLDVTNKRFLIKCQN